MMSRNTLYSQFTILLVVMASCAGATPLLKVEVETWGTMREVLREGLSEGRVVPAAIAKRGSFGVGALAGLAGEVTIVDGRVLVATKQRADGGEKEGAPRVREALPGDAAALLVLAKVPSWESVPIGKCASYKQLEAIVRKELQKRGSDVSKPQPIWVRGRARQLALHVIGGACPIADPLGPKPWRFSGPVDAVELVGVYVEGGAGRLTHHNRRSHLHAVAEGLMGHLDEIELEDAVLLLPARK